MSDVFDEIIDRLPPSTVRLILDFDNDRLNLSGDVGNLLRDIQRCKINHANEELKRKIVDVKSKTDENRRYLLKMKNELEVLKSLKSSVDNERSIKAYVLKINELESKVKSLTGSHGGVDLDQLFNEIEDLNNQIEDCKKKISEAKSKYQCYDGFPPDIEKGKEVIERIKERIKHNESVVESFFQPRDGLLSN